MKVVIFLKQFFTSYIDISEISWTKGACGQTFFRLGGVTRKKKVEKRGSIHYIYIILYCNETLCHTQK